MITFMYNKKPKKARRSYRLSKADGAGSSASGAMVGEAPEAASTGA